MFMSAFCGQLLSNIDLRCVVGELQKIKGVGGRFSFMLTVLIKIRELN